MTNKSSKVECKETLYRYFRREKALPVEIRSFNLRYLNTWPLTSYCFVKWGPTGTQSSGGLWSKNSQIIAIVSMIGFALNDRSLFAWKTHQRWLKMWRNDRSFALWLNRYLCISLEFRQGASSIKISTLVIFFVSKVRQGSGTVVECAPCDWKVVGLNPTWSWGFHLFYLFLSLMCP